MVPARPDLRGIDHIFTFAAMPGPITCFEGVQLLPRRPLFCKSLRATNRGASAAINERAYWEMDFPDSGDEDPGDDPETSGG